MRLRLIPREHRFFELFVADGENLLLAVRELEDMVRTYDRLEERVASIRAIEHRSDEIDVEINQKLDATFVTPFDAEDIHALTVRLDDVVDRVQEIAETFIIYGIRATTDNARRLAGILAAQGAQLVEALRALDGFRGIEPHLVEIHRLENEADGLSRAAVAELFADGADPLEVIKWRDVYKVLEEAIDAAEDAAEVIERIVKKTS